MMHITSLLALVSLTQSAVIPRAREPRVIFSNDDSLGSLSLFQFWNVFHTGTDLNYLVSAPCGDRSGTDSRDTNNTTPDNGSRAQGECRFNLTIGTPGHPYGHGINADGTENPHLYWVNGYPVTAMRLGISKFAGEVFGANLKPDIAFSGPNVGSNMDSIVSASGTAGTAAYAVKNNIPAICFSGNYSKKSLAWNDAYLSEGQRNEDSGAATSTMVYLASHLGVQVMNAAGEAGKFLPDGVFLNVNFPNTDPAMGCKEWDTDFRWVLSYTKLASNTVAPPVPHGRTCTRVPSEREVLSVAGQNRCLISLSLTNAAVFGVGSLGAYETVVGSLKGLRWACLY